MRTRPLLHTLLAIAATSLVFGCADDEQPPKGDDEVGDGDGEGDDEIGDGDGEPGDGDGEPGDGDGEPGDGDGEPGDGDGEPGDGDGEPGDGDGEPGDGDGDGDGQPSDACQMAADMIAPELAQAGGGCSILVRFNYQTLDPISWTSICGPYVDEMLTEEDARKLSECCSDGMRLGAPEDDRIFVFHTPAETEGGISVISNHLGQRSFEATILSGGAGDIVFPDDWTPAENLGDNCGADNPPGEGYDLAMEGAELDQTELDLVLQAFADTALTQAIEKNSMIQRTLTLAYPRTVGPFDPTTAEYVMIIEAGE